MPIILTLTNGSQEIKRSYQDPKFIVTRDCGDNCFDKKPVDEVVVGECICNCSKPGPSLEVTAVEVL